MPSNRESKSSKGADSTLSLPPGLTLSVIGCNNFRICSGFSDKDLIFCVFSSGVQQALSQRGGVCVTRWVPVQAGMEQPLLWDRWVLGNDWSCPVLPKIPVVPPHPNAQTLLLKELKPKKRRPSAGQNLRRPWVYVSIQKFRCLCKYSEV